MTELVCHVELFESWLEDLLISSEAFSGRVLFSDFSKCVLHEFFEFPNFLTFAFKVFDGPHEVQEKNEHSVVVIVTGISGDLCYCENLFFVEVVTEAFDIFTVFSEYV